MKKLFLLAAAFIMLSMPSIYAQTAPAATPKANTAKMKKDGTPDKRYKANKAPAADAAATTGPTKKDGTPDMRYKTNKGAAKAKK